MRETVTDFETKVKTVEKEREVVWCDTCGNKCTENHEVVPQELCPTCQPDEEEQGWTMSEYREAFQKHGASDDMRMTKGNAALFVSLFPLFLLAAIADAADDANDNAARWFVVGALGLVVWIGVMWVLSKIAIAIGFVPT